MSGYLGKALDLASASLHRASFRIGAAAVEQGVLPGTAYRLAAEVVSLGERLHPGLAAHPVRNWVNVASALENFRRAPQMKEYSPVFPEVCLPPLMRNVSMDNLIEAYDVFFVDLYGVVQDRNGVMPQAISTIKRMAERGKLVIFVSNTGDRLPEDIVSYYAERGLEIPPDQISTSGMILADWIRKKGLAGKEVINVGDNAGCTAYIQRAGAIPLPHANAMQTYAQAKAVILGLIDGFPQEVKDAALNAIRRNNVPVVVTNTDEVVPTGEGEVRVMTGALAVEFERYTGRPVDRLGKPFRPIYEQAYRLAQAKRPKLNPSRVLVIGDTLQLDILGAQNSGYDSLLVLTGTHRQLGELDRLEDMMLAAPLFPTYVLPALG